jgi:hypothetical protein
LNVIDVFHQYELSNYADELVKDYDDLENDVRRTAFSSYTVYSNWNPDDAYSTSGHTLAAWRCHASAVIAGVFTSYNRQELSEGDHYLVEVRSPD